jgi:PAS domain S-box-containing protein
MIAAKPAPNHTARLQALDELRLLDTPADPVLDGLVRSAALMLDCTIARVSLIDRERQWFKAQAGLDIARTVLPTPRELAFCAHAILGTDLFVVPDAAADPRFADNPLVLGEPPVRFYAGAPLAVGGHNIGTLCVIDRRPRTLDDTQRTLLADLARAIEHWIVSRHEHNQLLETQGFLTKIACHVPGMFFQYHRGADGRSRFPYASEGIHAIYELTSELVRRDAQPAFDRLHADDRDEVRAAVERSARTLMPWWQQYRVVLPQGGVRWLEGHATPERADDGSVLWSGFIQDITERRASEQVHRDKLASERASQAKSEFLSRVSHELRTPLNAVLGFTQLLQAEAVLGERAQGHLEQARKGGQRLLALVNDILDLSRIEQGLLTLRSVPVAVIDVLEASLALIEPLAGQRGIRIMPLRGDADAIVRADPRALEQVLLNLLSNGVKYNREGGALWIETRRLGADVAIGVSDEGPGLTPQQRQRLFQPFDRLGAENSRVDGSGLGLVISKQLTEAMRGRLEVHGRADGGCRFEVWLPANPAESQTEPVALDEPATPLRPKRRRRGAPLPLVLCVEDDPVNALLLQEFINTIGGCRTLFADNGETALQLARLHRPALMLSDVNLPTMDGVRLVSAIRADPALQAMRCIALSGDATAPSHARALLAGFDSYWTKPLDLVLLSREIASLEKAGA